MIDIQVSLHGQNSSPPLTRSYYFRHESDEKIFLNSVQLVMERIQKK